MSLDEGKKYTLKLEAEANSFRDLLSLLIEIVGEVHDSEEVIKESGFIMTGKSATSNSHCDIVIEPWALEKEKEKTLIPGWEEENQLAKDYGWTPVPDPYRGDGWCKFSRGDEWVWSVYPKWIRAKTQDDKYTNHMEFSHLEAALNGEVIK